jgi:gliding motility-associated-like protein
VASTVNLSGKTPLATNLEKSNWKVSPTSGVTLNTTIDVAAATATFSATGTYVFTYEIDNPTCPEKKQTVTVVVADKPATGTVTGTDPTCEEGTGTYTATGFTSTLPVTYAWTSTPSATSTATTTDAKKQSVTYTFKSTNPTAATDNATVDVIAKNACGTASGSKAVSYGLKPRVFDVPGGPITGSTQFCSTKPTTQPYTVGGSVQATKYNWKWNTQALSGTTTSNNLTDIIWGTATSGTLEVVLENACGVGTFATAKTSIAITIDQPVAFEADITSNAPDQKFCVPQAGVTYTASSIPLTVTPTGYTFSTSSSAVTQTDVALKTWLPAVDVVKDLGKVKVTITASDDPLNANFACLKNYTATDSIIMDGYKYPDSLIVSSVDTICDNQSDIVLSVNRSLNGSNKFNDNDQPRWFLNDTLAQPQFDGRFSINLGDANQSGIWKVKIPGSICSTHVSADTHRVKIYEQPDFLFAENPMVVVYQDGITKRMPVVLVSPARDSITKTTWTNETWLEYPLNDTLNALFVPKREQVELEYSLILRTGAAKFNCTTEKPLVVINALPLNIPNAFSPNGDGVNDTWVINGLIKYSSVTVSVFNRWGNKVFYSTGAYTPWDGAVNGIPVSSGTYYAIVELKGSPDGTDDNVSKALTIVR